VLAERLGFSSCVLPHHLLPPAWPRAVAAARVWYDPIPLIAFLAARTSRLVFRTGVLVVPYHRPVQLAKAVATLDLVSRGRFRLGVGSGWLRAEFRRLGIPYDERGAMTDEYLRAMRELWEAEAPAFSGRWVSFDDVSFLPRPRSRRIPVDVGGTGPRVFRRVAELGDGWWPLALPSDAVAAGLAEIRSLLEARGRDAAGLAVVSNLAVDRDPETAGMAAHASAEGGRGADLSAAPAETRSLTAQECVAAIEGLRAAGVTDVVLELAWRSGADLRDRLQWFADHVIPALGGSQR
jgi:probable F420-dependent oxidoreductase